MIHHQLLVFFNFRRVHIFSFDAGSGVILRRSRRCLLENRPRWVLWVCAPGTPCSVSPLNGYPQNPAKTEVLEDPHHHPQPKREPWSLRAGPRRKPGVSWSQVRLFAEGSCNVQVTVPLLGAPDPLNSILNRLLSWTPSTPWSLGSAEVRARLGQSRPPRDAGEAFGSLRGFRTQTQIQGFGVVSCGSLHYGHAGRDEQGHHSGPACCLGVLKQKVAVKSWKPKLWRLQAWTSIPLRCAIGVWELKLAVG